MWIVAATLGTAVGSKPRCAEGQVAYPRRKPAAEQCRMLEGTLVFFKFKSLEPYKEEVKELAATVQAVQGRRQGDVP